MSITCDRRAGRGAIGEGSAELTSGPSTSAFTDVIVDDENAPPPPFMEQDDGPVDFDYNTGSIVISSEGEEPPPAFTTYDAEYSVDSSGSIYTHDVHLNSDGEALYRFLLAHAAIPPQYLLKVRGTRSVTNTKCKEISTEEKVDRTTTATDFDFAIDVGQQVFSSGVAHTTQHQPVHWSVSDQQPAYRGQTYLATGIPGSATLRKASISKSKQQKERDAVRLERGLPPWVDNILPPRGAHNYNTSPHGGLRSSWTLRRWADDYCASDKLVKEFMYEKVVYGWDTATLTAAIRKLVQNTGYQGKVEVSFEVSSAHITVKSSNRLAHALLNPWVRILLIITLIYPFIALFLHFRQRWSGRWEVCGGAYALKTWADVPTDSLSTDPNGASGARFLHTPEGVKMLLGEPEGEWFRRWEATIRNCVLNHHREPTPLKIPDDSTGENHAAGMLDSYHQQTLIPQQNATEGSTAIRTMKGRPRISTLRAAWGAFRRSPLAIMRVMQVKRKFA
jgi:hypothetical protein